VFWLPPCPICTSAFEGCQTEQVRGSAQRCEGLKFLGSGGIPDLGDPCLWTVIFVSLPHDALETRLVGIGPRIHAHPFSSNARAHQSRKYVAVGRASLMARGGAELFL
jgi:hypothetical protein